MPSKKMVVETMEIAYVAGPSAVSVDSNVGIQTMNEAVEAGGNIVQPGLRVLGNQTANETKGDR